jgi:hypothetical protein
MNPIGKAPRYIESHFADDTLLDDIAKSPAYRVPARL